MTDTQPSMQPMVVHLLEMRNRLLQCIMVIFIIFLGLFSYSNELYIYISEPLTAHLPAASSMIATDVTSPFLTPFKLALVLSVFAAMPFILYQIWAFVAPGLYQREKKIVAWLDYITPTAKEIFLLLAQSKKGTSPSKGLLPFAIFWL